MLITIDGATSLLITSLVVLMSMLDLTLEGKRGRSFLYYRVVCSLIIVCGYH